MTATCKTCESYAFIRREICIALKTPHAALPYENMSKCMRLYLERIQNLYKNILTYVFEKMPTCQVTHKKYDRMTGP